MHDQLDKAFLWKGTHSGCLPIRYPGCKAGVQVVVPGTHIPNVGFVRTRPDDPSCCESSLEDVLLAERRPGMSSGAPQTVVHRIRANRALAC